MDASEGGSSCAMGSCAPRAYGERLTMFSKATEQIEDTSETWIAVYNFLTTAVGVAEIGMAVGAFRGAATFADDAAVKAGGGLAGAQRAGGFGWGMTSEGVPYAQTLWSTSAASAKHEANHAAVFFRCPQAVIWSATSRAPGAATGQYAIEVLAYRAQGMSWGGSLVWAEKSVAATGREALLARDFWLAAGGLGVGAGVGAWALGDF